MTLRAGRFAFQFPRPALLMGVVNVTPDSFSDGGRYFSTEAAAAHALALIEEGADVVDIGGESTRPQATPVEEGEELRRVIPVIKALAGRVAVPISIDTVKPSVARAAIECGASFINDIAANRAEDTMWRLAAEAGVGYIAMHMQGDPATMQRQPVYQDVVGEVGEFFADRLGRLLRAGVRAEQVVLDIGIGFGKTIDHNLQLLAALERFTKYNRPLLLGASRKSFIGRLAGAPSSAGRQAGSIACACWAVAAGVQIIRTHDVAATRQAVLVTEAIISKRPQC